MDYARRFSGISRLYGKQGLESIRDSNVAVIGVGGVGSWAVEGLARSGIGNISLYDLDHVAESNINRQLPALEHELGKAKVKVMAQRVGQINSECRVEAIEEFIEAKNLQQLIGKKFDYVIDCIDNYRTKAALIAYCKINKLPIITVGGAGGQTDPTKICKIDLSRSEQDPLLSKTRKLLRQNYKFPANLKRRFGVPSVYSTEQQKAPADLSCLDSDKEFKSDLNCAGYGSVMTVTATFGLVAVSHVLSVLAEKSKSK
ncbi:MAG: tRNA threonylcarbamoyladenosine dehydratase [Candidatus Thiodiazotropha lotti]|nr:tRNA threonylcarbamoyladenosine dehydratase [Candidatus Thiodiazotropha lotti]MCG8003533.1 tRNA threonylcarbamoyladenosine dehydratase [Candidatus Thiodiazotropha lotti]MCW4187154.1 tRNA threonylcarbamoyladenosine dehydratase [Candidatus Thiodiazotropha lotti]MCW4200219.1 tRNA threonylcarbamoyladenosine dehydratase [Candidatus Thiodiazotropha lotti]